MIRKAIFMMALCVCGQLHANEETIDDGTDDLVPSGINEDMLRQIEPTYLKEVAVPSAWSSNWFVGVSGGTSAFVGKPHGKGNLFDRMKPSLAIKAGKWFTPEIGGFSLECDQQFCQRPCHHTKMGIHSVCWLRYYP